MKQEVIGYAVEYPICPLCQKGKLKFYLEPDTVEYKGSILIVDMEYAECLECKEDMILPIQVRKNDARLKIAWRKHDENHQS